MSYKVTESEEEKKLSKKARKALRKQKRKEEQERRKKEREAKEDTNKIAAHSYIPKCASKTKWGEHNAKEPTVTCSLVSSDEPTIFLGVEARQKIEVMMDEFPHSEWIGYLVGMETQRHNFIISDLVIPPHKEVNAAGVEAEPFHIPDKCIAVIHSHHSMGAFHSTTDDDHVDRNYPVSITVAGDSEDLDFDAVSIRKTPCGRISSVECKVEYLEPAIVFDKEEWLKEAKANVAKGERVYPHYGGYGGYGGYQGHIFPPYVPDGRGVNHHFPADHWRNQMAANNMAALHGRKIVPVRNTAAAASPLRSVTAEEVDTVRNRLKILFDLELTRSEVEDMILRSPPGTDWAELGDKS